MSGAETRPTRLQDGNWSTEDVATELRVCGPNRQAVLGRRDRRAPAGCRPEVGERVVPHRVQRLGAVHALYGGQTSLLDHVHEPSLIRNAITG